MLLRNKSYQKRAPSRDAKKIFLICEGNVREHDYFAMFRGFDSRIHIEIIVQDTAAGGDNSPTGLFSKAKELFSGSKEDPSSKLEMLDGDELWFVIDTDTWGDKLAKLREACEVEKGWEVAQSNPCFEVWLYYHFFPKPTTEVGFEISENWKQLLNRDVLGGFDSKKHYLLIQTAILHASQSYFEANGQPTPGSTQVFRPASSIYQIAKQKIDRMLHDARI
jgi:hypothetical protein